MKSENVKKKYIEMVMNRTNEIAKERLAIQPTTQHLVLAILEQLSESYIANQAAAFTIANLKSDMEVLRRAIFENSDSDVNDKKKFQVLS